VTAAQTPTYLVYPGGAGIWGIRDTTVDPDTVRFAAFDGYNASVQVAALLNAGALPAEDMVWTETPLNPLENA
jgi:hypothetical protein